MSRWPSVVISGHYSDVPHFNAVGEDRDELTVDFDVNAGFIDHFSVAVPHTGALLLVGSDDRIELEFSHSINVNEVEIELKHRYGSSSVERDS